MTRIVASMIVKDEMGRYLPLAVKHLLTFCDEVRVLDDNSTDGSFEWLVAQDGVAVARNGGPAFFEYESKARQNLLEWTMKAEPEYVLSIDADEFIDDPVRLVKMAALAAPVYTLDMLEVWGADAGGLDLRIDGQWGPRRCPILWRAPAQLDDISWHIPDRKLACGREPLAVRRGRFQASSVGILHFGWTCRSDREGRAERYFEHDKGQFHKDAHLQSILWPDEKVRTMRRRWPDALQDSLQPFLDRINR